MMGEPITDLEWREMMSGGPSRRDMDILFALRTGGEWLGWLFAGERWEYTDASGFKNTAERFHAGVKG